MVAVIVRKDRRISVAVAQRLPLLSGGLGGVYGSVNNDVSSRWMHTDPH